MTIYSDLAPLLRRFVPYLKEVRGRWIAAACLLAAGPALSACLLWSVKILVDDVFVGHAFEQLPLLIAIYLAITVGKVAVSYASTRLDASIIAQITQSVRVDLYRHAMKLSPGTIRHSIGDLLTRLSGDAERVEYLIYTGLLGLCADVLAVIVFGSFLLALSWQLTVCALLIAPILAIVSLRLAPKIRRASRAARRGVAAWTSLAEERLGATAAVQVFDAAEFETAAFARRCTAARRAELRAVSVQAWSSAMTEAVAVVGGLCVILVGAMGIQNGAVTVGTLIAFLGSVGSLSGPIGSLAKSPSRFLRAAVRIRRVSDLLDTPSAVAEKPGALSLAKPQGLIEFTGVNFGYSPRQQVLHDVTLRIEAGETVAIVGPNGSGKSSLVKLALRLYDPWSGAVRIDGHDLRDITFNSLRQAASVVLQEPCLFRGTIAENIAYGRNPADPAAIIAAARATHVSGFAEAMPGGYDSAVGPAGDWLSGGQRQRVALARALLRDTPILLLDEATGAIDGETEDMIQHALERLAGHRTMLIVGHRLSSIRRADRIVVMEDGRIVESGKPDVLLQSSSRCRALFAAQLTSSELAA
jgi:ABC-type multidrug transport system fused ATPase/permease subunit